MDSTPLRVALLRPRAAKRLGRGATPTYMASRDDFNVFVVRGHGVCDSSLTQQLRSSPICLSTDRSDRPEQRSLLPPNQRENESQTFPIIGPKFLHQLAKKQGLVTVARCAGNGQQLRMPCAAPGCHPGPAPPVFPGCSIGPVVLAPGAVDADKGESSEPGRLMTRALVGQRCGCRRLQQMRLHRLALARR